MARRDHETHDRCLVGQSRPECRAPRRHEAVCGPEMQPSDDLLAPTRHEPVDLPRADEVDHRGPVLALLARTVPRVEPARTEHEAPAVTGAPGAVVRERRPVEECEPVPQPLGVEHLDVRAIVTRHEPPPPTSMYP